MATAAPITGAPTRARPFEVNGCTDEPDEPYSYLDQAHGVLACLEVALRETNDGPLNALLVEGAARAARTLVHLAARGLDTMDRKREGR